MTDDNSSWRSYIATSTGPQESVEEQGKRLVREVKHLIANALVPDEIKDELCGDLRIQKIFKQYSGEVLAWR